MGMSDMDLAISDHTVARELKSRQPEAFDAHPNPVYVRPRYQIICLIDQII
jgi:hypothetical protein